MPIKEGTYLDQCRKENLRTDCGERVREKAKLRFISVFHVGTSPWQR